VKRFALESALLFEAASASAEGVPPGYPGILGEFISAAEAGRAASPFIRDDSASADLLLKDFQRAYPKVQDQILRLNRQILQHRISADRGKAETADVLWSGSAGHRTQHGVWTRERIDPRIFIRLSRR